MGARPVIVDERGNPLRMVAHDAADRGSREMASWHPGTYSGDSEWLGELETARDRLDDLIRNNGLASGAVQIHVDNTIGSNLLLNYRPDRLALGLKPGTRDDEMDEFESMVESKWDAFSEDPACWIDASRRARFSGLISQGYRSFLSSFEIIATGEWLTRPGAKFRTAIQMIDPRRLCNPEGERDSDRLRGGVALDAMGAPVGYWIASHVRGDPTEFSGMRTWKYVPRETPWGRQLAMHVYECDKAGRSRGKGGVLSVLAGHKMHERFTKASVEAAIFNAMYAAYIESSLDWTAVSQAMGGGENDPTLSYLSNVTDFHKEGMIRFNGLRIPHLYPGESLKHLSPQHPAPSFEAFERAANRRLAAGWNLTYGQISRDYSQSNYSSERAALIEAWRFFSGRQYHVAGFFSTMVFSLWFEESVDRGDVVLPSGLPDFYSAKSAWITSDWIGPGRGHIDILKESNGKKVAKSMGLETMESLAALDGRRWRDLIDQAAQEDRYMRKRGLDPAQFNGPTPVAQPPDAPERNRDDGQDEDDPHSPQGNEGRRPSRGPTGGNAVVPIAVSDESAIAAALAENGRMLADAVRALAQPPAIHINVVMTGGTSDDDEREEQARRIAQEVGSTVAQVTQQAQAQTISRIAQEMSRPIVLVKNKQGRTIGSKRVDKLPDEEAPA